MLKGRMSIGKKGEVSETMTWMVATIIIFVLIFLFLYAVNLMGGAKNLNFVFKLEDSGKSTQEMLFGILNKEVNGKKISEMIGLGENDVAKSEIDKILSDFAYYGVKCDFVSSEFKVRKGGSGKEVKMDVSGKEVSLKC